MTNQNQDITERKGIEEALRESEEKYRTLFEDSRDGIYIITRKGKFVDFNKALEEISCYTRDELLMLNVLELYVNPDDRVKFQQEIEQKGSVKDYEIRFRKKDGTEIDCLITTTVQLADDGSILGYQGIVRDITERKQMEEKIRQYTENLEKLVQEQTKALRESEEKLRAILAGMGDYITIQNRDFDIIWANRLVKDLFGEDIIGKKCYRAYHGSEEKCINCALEKVFNEGKVVDWEGGPYRVSRPEYTLVTSSPMRDAEGNIVAMVEVVKDNTVRKKLEIQLKEYTENLEKLVEERTKELRESEEKFRATLTGIGDIITIHNGDLDIIWVNQTVRDIWGDVIGKKCYAAYKKLHAPCPGCSVEKVFNEEKMVVSESLISRPDGRNIHTLVTSSPVRDADGNIVAVVEVAKDITERKKLEWQLKDYTENLEKLVEERAKELRESEEKLKAILTGIGDYITIQNRDLDIIWANQPVIDLWGEIIGKKCYEVYHRSEEQCPGCMPRFEKVFNEGETVVWEGEVIPPGGIRLPLLTTSSPVKDSKGNIVAMIEVIKDNTEHKQLEEKIRQYTENLEELVEERTFELKESEFRYRSLFKDSRDAIYITTRKGKLIDVNQAMLELFGYTKDELLMLNVLELYVNPDDRVKFQQGIEQRGSVRDYEVQLRKKDGTVMDCLLTSTVWLADDGSIMGYQGIIRDITEQRREEEKTKRYTKDLERIVDERTGDLKEVQRLLYNIYYKI